MTQTTCRSFNPYALAATKKAAYAKGYEAGLKTAKKYVLHEDDKEIIEKLLEETDG